MLKILRYLCEYSKWWFAGKPVRSQKEVQDIFNICEQCDKFNNWKDGTGECRVCGCSISLDHNDHQFNKASWATTKCPLEKPKWQ